MKFLDKFNLMFFSILIIIISVTMTSLIFGIIDMDLLNDIFEGLLDNDIAKYITAGVLILCILLALKSLFFNSFSREKQKEKEGIIIENDNGKLLVSKDTIESLTNTVVKSFDSVENVTTRISIGEEQKVKIFITLFVKMDAVIKDLSNKLQLDIKDAIKKSLDLDVSEVNIKIKNIETKKETIIKE